MYAQWKDERDSAQQTGFGQPVQSEQDAQANILAVQMMGQEEMGQLQEGQDENPEEIGGEKLGTGEVGEEVSQMEKMEEGVQDKEKGKKVAVVTGANRGLGLSLVKKLCSEFDGDVYLTSRDTVRGEAAIDDLKSAGLNPLYHQLDISSHDSIETFKKHIEEQHGGIDILISNAAIAYDKDTDVPVEEQVETTIAINNHGTADALSLLLPLVRSHGRVVVLSGEEGVLTNLNQELHGKFDTDTLTIDQLNEVLSEYVEAVKDESCVEKGWPEAPKIVSRLGLVVLTRILARDLRSDTSRDDVIINACSPGWIVTDSSQSYLDENNEVNGVKAKLPDEAADDVIYLAMLPEGTKEPSGCLIKYRNILPFSEQEDQASMEQAEETEQDKQQNQDGEEKENQEEEQQQQDDDDKEKEAEEEIEEEEQAKDEEDEDQKTE